METKKELCHIWGTPVKDSRGDAFEDAIIVSESPRAGGDYKMTPQAYKDVGSLEPTQKAKLTTILIESRQRGDQMPLVTSKLIEKAKDAKPLPVYVRAERLLRYLVTRPHQIGEILTFHSIQNDLEAFAWTESAMPTELMFFFNYLKERGWLVDSNVPGRFVIAVEGYAHIEEQSAQRDLSQCFVAMWFDDSMNSALEEGIEKAVKECGYTPKRIDQKQHFNKICDEAIAEIRRSRFVVADFTHGADGARGSVFYEAGFAHALGLPVIFSCQKDPEKPLHFDTRQYPHILWEEPEDLYAELRDKIGALIGDYKAEPTHAF